MVDFFNKYDNGMDCGYKLLVGIYTLEEVLPYLNKMFLPFDPTEDFIVVEDLDHMIEYYENLEEYEKCQKILDIKNNTVSETILT